MPDLYIIAGPNGAGKTTAAFKLLPHVINVREFVNADEIAKGISPFNPETVSIQAGKIMLQRIEALIQQQTSFVIETTLTTIGYLKTIEAAKAKGYDVTLFYIYLNSVDLAKERVKQRVNKGGHNIPTEIIERRYFRALQNLGKFMQLADAWYLFDNSGSEYENIAKMNSGKKEIYNFELYSEIISHGRN